MRVLLAALGAVFYCSVALAHIHDRPDLTSWLKTLRNGGGIPCCDQSDAVPLVDAEWRVEKDHYQVFIKARWWDVPESALVKGPNKDGRTLVWYGGLLGADIYIRCFMPGAGV